MGDHIQHGIGDSAPLGAGPAPIAGHAARQYDAANRSAQVIDPAWFQEEQNRVSEKLREKLGVRRGSFAKRMRRAGRLMPTPAKRAVKVLTQAQQMVDHPRLRRIVNEGQMRAALRDVHSGLDGIDPKDRRKGALLGLAGSIVFNLMLAGAALIVILRWQGLI
ncbi:hypothetical protein O4H61_10945 [Roseovarius aestuarii]|nr:hypothetical protein [Roseovarius aestuarii]